MTTIAEIADRIGEHICQQAGLNQNQNKVRFGIEILLIMSITTFSTLIIAGICGLFFETLAVMMAALGIKFIIGSSHLSGFSRCLIYSICLSLIGAILTKAFISWLTVPLIILIMVMNWLILSISPLLLSYRTLDKKADPFPQNLGWQHSWVYSSDGLD
ncbi:MAG TPA: accessory gene regulator B family protein [Bacillota bacterium]|nr:accessory gene regulator B family protein [Bacillota bacterium]